MNKIINSTILTIIISLSPAIFAEDRGFLCELATTNCVGGYFPTNSEMAEISNLKLTGHPSIQVARDNQPTVLFVDGEKLVYKNANGTIDLGTIEKPVKMDQMFGRHFTPAKGVSFEWSEKRGETQRSCETNGIGRHFNVWYHNLDIDIALSLNNENLHNFTDSLYVEEKRRFRFRDCP